MRDTTLKAPIANLRCFVMPQSKAGAQVKDLMNRLNNAVKQRNAAREEALLASEKLKAR